MPSKSSRSSNRRRTRYLTFDDLNSLAYELARYLFADWLKPMPVLHVLGGKEGAGVLAGILALPKQSAGRKAAYSSIFDKAAALFRSMTLDHPFVDGNKRMAVATTLAFLGVNDWIVVATDDELVNLALGVASGNVRERDTLARWFEMNSASFEDLAVASECGRVEEFVRELPGTARLQERRLLALVLGERL